MTPFRMSPVLVWMGWMCPVLGVTTGFIPVLGVVQWICLIFNLVMYLGFVCRISFVLFVSVVNLLKKRTTYVLQRFRENIDAQAASTDGTATLYANGQTHMFGRKVL